MYGMYYVHTGIDNKGNHEVHKSGCEVLPHPDNRIYLGYCNNCQEALDKAKQYYSNVDGCFFCSISCHNE